MNLGISIKVALAKKSMKRAVLAEALNTTDQNVYHLINRNYTNTETLKRLAAAFDMTVSEFVKLGEE